MSIKILSASCRVLLTAAVVAWPMIGSSANLIVNNGFENNPPGLPIGNHIPWPITPWVLGPGAAANVVTVNGGTGYGNGGPNLDAEGHASGTLQYYLDINGGNNTISQTFTVPTCGATDTEPRIVDFSGYFSVRDYRSASGSGYIRILDQSVLDGAGMPTELAIVNISNLTPTDASGAVADPINQTWKPFGSSVAVTPGHQITYQAYITDYLNFDNAYMAFKDFTCPSTTLAMAKQWNAAPAGHIARLIATRDAGATQVDQLDATSNGSAGQLVVDSSPLTVFAGDKIRISETLSNIGSTQYSQTLSCTGDTTVTNVGTGVFDVEVGNVSANTAPIVCTMVNTNVTQSTLKLSKKWDGGQEGDIATVTATALQSGGAAPAPLTSTATSLANGAAGQLQSGMATVVSQGASFSLAESIANTSASPGVYDTQLTCTYAQVNDQTITINQLPGTQAECTMRNTLAALTIQKQASAPSDTNGSGVVGDVGDEITYTFTVTNTGRADLINVQINDALLSAANSSIVWMAGTAPAALPVNGVATAMAVYTITTADAANPSEEVTNTATASAETSTGHKAVTSPPDTTHTPVKASHPSLSITKAASIADSNHSGLRGDLGDVITYQFVVTNTGDTRLTGVQIIDPLPGLTTPTFTAWPNQFGVLEAGETVNASATYTIQSVDVIATKVDNQASASANPLAGVSPTAQSQWVRVPTVAPQPKLSISKTASVADSNNSGTKGDVGDVVTYTLTVHNLGNSSLAGVSITDPMSGLSALSILWPDPTLPGTLPIGGMATATATYSIRATDVLAGQVVNTATAEALPVAGLAVEIVSDTAHVQTVTVPLVASNPVPTLGEWSLISLFSLLAMFGVACSRKRRD